MSLSNIISENKAVTGRVDGIWEVKMNLIEVKIRQVESKSMLLQLLITLNVAADGDWSENNSQKQLW